MMILPIVAAYTGEYILRVKYNSLTYDFIIDGIAGNRFEMDNYFNEQGTSTFQIVSPSGQLVTVEEDGTLYNCFLIKTFIAMTNANCTPTASINCCYEMAAPKVTINATGTNTLTIPPGDIAPNSIQFFANGALQTLGAAQYGWSYVVNTDMSITVTTTETWGSVADPCVINIYYNVKTFCK